MAHNFPYLNNSSFLQEFDKTKIKEQIIKIIVLDFKEKPIQQIQGKILSGNISVDGTSSMRRTCNLNMVIDEYENDFTNINNLLSINKKIEVLIGFTNTTNQYKDYPILWFPQGVYLIIAINITHNSGGLNVSLTLHDKMALLNGECGGVLPASIILSEIEDIDENGQSKIRQPTIFQIIQQLVNHFGGEQLGKIIIADLDNTAKEIMRWTGAAPLYYYYQNSENNNIYYHFSTKINDFQQQDPSRIKQFNSGDDIGYILTDFVYPTQLISKAGDTVCSILDQIKNTLGNYEYFYDINGNFVFREIKNYLNKKYSNEILTNINNNDYTTDYTTGKSVYTFKDTEIISSISNSPQYQQIKNDFIIWGKRKSNGQQIPIRYHLAIDDKPEINNEYYIKNVGDEEQKYIIDEISGSPITTTDFRTELFMQGLTAQPLALEKNYYYTQLQNEWWKIYDVMNGEFKQQAKNHPNQIDFFLDFIDTHSQIGQYSIPNIGRRTVVLVDDSINCIFAPEIPDIVIIQSGQIDTSQKQQECNDRKQAYVLVEPQIYNMILPGGVLKSAYDEIKKQLYQYTTFNEQVSLTTLPIYYLQPNTRVTIQNTNTGIFGDFMIKSFSLPLDINGTMNISCTKALERI